MDAIHVHVEERIEHVEGNTALETNDYLWIMHESWCCVNPPCTQTLKLLPSKKSTYKQSEKIRMGHMKTNSQKPK
jgi:hypothetical protein